MHVAGTDPYPWPYDGRLDGAHLAVVLAGWDAHWQGRCVDPSTAIMASRCLADAVLGIGGFAVAVAHHGSELLPGDDDRILAATAAGLDGFFGGPLDTLLRSRRIKHLLVAGLGMEGPVHSTLRSANDQGYECLLVLDAAAPLTPDLQAAAAKTVTMSGGIFGAVGTLACVLQALDEQHRPISTQEQ